MQGGVGLGALCRAGFGHVVWVPDGPCAGHHQVANCQLRQLKVRMVARQGLPAKRLGGELADGEQACPRLAIAQWHPRAWRCYCGGRLLRAFDLVTLGCGGMHLKADDFQAAPAGHRPVTLCGHLYKHVMRRGWRKKKPALLAQVGPEKSLSAARGFAHDGPAPATVDQLQSLAA